nr:hypothetical protein MFLOJ_29460 [Mycobacterium florentinum]
MRRPHLQPRISDPKSIGHVEEFRPVPAISTSPHSKAEGDVRVEPLHVLTPVSTIGAVAGPPQDFNNEPTRYRDVGRGGGPPADGPPADEPPQPAPGPVEPQTDPFDDETEPTAWYRKPVGLIIWGLSVLVLIALIVYGIVQLIGDQGTTSNPKTSTTTPSTTTTTVTTTPPSSAPTTTTTTTTAPPTSSAEAPEPTHQPTQQQPTHRHHWPSWLPTTIPALP